MAQGRVRTKRAAEAREWCLQAAETGLPDAEALMGFMYLAQYGSSANRSLGLFWLWLATVGDTPLAQSFLGSMYAVGDLVAQDRPTAYVLYTVASDTSPSEPQFGASPDRGAAPKRAGLLYPDMTDQECAAVEPLMSQSKPLPGAGEYQFRSLDQEKAIEGALTRDPVALREAAGRCDKGDGDRRCAWAAARWYGVLHKGGHLNNDTLLASARAGECRAQRTVALLYEHGIVLLKDPVEVSAWYRRAAARGDPFAQYVFADRCGKDEGVTQDIGQEIRWCHRAARQVYVEALARLGFLYRQYASGVRQRPRLARFYCLWAASEGDISALRYRRQRIGSRRASPVGSRWAAKTHRAAVNEGNATSLSLPRAAPAPAGAVVLVCDPFGFEDIHANPTAPWKPALRRYELASTFDNHTCNGCGRDCTAIKQGQVQYRVTMRTGASWLFATDAPEDELVERAQAEWDRRHSARGDGGRFRFVSTDIRVHSVILEHQEMPG